MLTGQEDPLTLFGANLRIWMDPSESPDTWDADAGPPFVRSVRNKTLDGGPSLNAIPGARPTWWGPGRSWGGKDVLHLGGRLRGQGWATPPTPVHWAQGVLVAAVVSHSNLADRSPDGVNPHIDGSWVARYGLIFRHLPPSAFGPVLVANYRHVGVNQVDEGFALQGNPWEPFLQPFALVRERTPTGPHVVIGRRCCDALSCELSISVDGTESPARESRDGGMSTRTELTPMVIGNGSLDHGSAGKLIGELGDVVVVHGNVDDARAAALGQWMAQRWQRGTTSSSGTGSSSSSSGSVSSSSSGPPAGPGVLFGDRLAAWFDAHDPELMEDAGVALWRDHSIHGNHAHAVDGGETPTLTQLGAMRAVRFVPSETGPEPTLLVIDGNADDSLSFGTGDYLVASALSCDNYGDFRVTGDIGAIWVKVTETPTMPGVGVFCGTTGDSVLPPRALMGQSRTLDWGPDGGSGEGAERQFVGSLGEVWDDGAAHVVAIRRRGNRMEAWVDGYLEGVDWFPAPENVDAPGRPVFIGGRFNGSGQRQQQLRGAMAGLVAVKGPVEDEELKALLSWMAAHHGISRP